MSSVLVYYPFFPTYRQGILENLSSRADCEFLFAAGTRGRAGIRSLTENEFSKLTVLRTRRLGGASFNPGIVRLAANSKYDAVIIAPATLSLSAWGILFTRALLRRPVFLWGQCGKPGARGLKRLAQEIMNRLATGLLVYGESERSAACAWGTNPSKVHVVHNAVEHRGAAAELSYSEFELQAHGRGIATPTPPAHINITYIGRVTNEKRLDLLLDAVKLLRHRFPTVSATIVGEGNALTGIRRRVDAEGLPVSLPGAIHDAAQLASILSSATVVVAPSEIGLLAIDALQHGVPVLYPVNSMGNGPEVEALTIGTNAAVIPAATPSEIAEAVEKWVESAAAIDLPTYYSVTKDSLRLWSPESVAELMIKAVSAEALKR